MQKLYSMLPLDDRKYIKRPHPNLEEADIDWSKTTAYCHHFGQIYINLKGREPKGLVNLRDYDILINRLKVDLSKIIIPGTNRKLVTQMYTSKEIYKGATDAPDIIVYLDDFWCAPLTTLGHSPLIQKMDLVGTHRMEGIFLAYGPNIIRKNLQDTHLIDVAPTILSLYGLRQTEMDGEKIDILKNIPKEIPTKEKINIFTENSTFSTKDENLIKDRLKNLGYFQ